MQFKTSSLGKGKYSYFYLIEMIMIVFQNGTFTLRNIVFNAHPGDLICVIGPVGCGKVCFVDIQYHLSLIYLEFSFTNINR
jgi:ABC-type uncharacterized transport system ATPase subunit